MASPSCYFTAIERYIATEDLHQGYIPYRRLHDLLGWLCVCDGDVADFLLLDRSIQRLVLFVTVGFILCKVNVHCAYVYVCVPIFALWWQC